MKKIIPLLFTLFLLASCADTDRYSVSVDEKLPKQIDTAIIGTSDTTLNVFSNGDGTYYIVYDTNKDVPNAPATKQNGNNMTINIIEGDELSNVTRHIFKFESSNTFEAIDFEVNGKPKKYTIITY
ncbi:MAG: hypothetical protein UHX00_11800 [Caryophanon sp.]|nr:hypothetical protein [Caryophanon sp.]